MYLIKEVGREVNAKELEENDVVSIHKKWYIVREKLGLSDELEITGLRDNKPYTMSVVIGFGTVGSLRKVGRVIEDKWVEDLDPMRNYNPNKVLKPNINFDNIININGDEKVTNES